MSAQKWHCESVGRCAYVVAHQIGYPVLVRPSYVLGGAAMRIVYSDQELTDYISIHLKGMMDNVFLIDKFLDDAIEIDVDALSDGNDCVVAALCNILKKRVFIPGDSASVLPAFSLTMDWWMSIREATV